MESGVIEVGDELGFEQWLLERQLDLVIDTAGNVLPLEMLSPDEKITFYYNITCLVKERIDWGM